MSGQIAGTIPELVASARSRFGGREAVADGDVRFSFSELAAAVERAARACAADGVRPGDRVAIWAPNSWRWIVAALGAVSAGGVLVPINTRFKGDEARYVLERSGARMLFTVTDFLGADYAAMLRESGASVERIVDLASIESFTGGGSLPDVGPDDLSDVIFTSGTTGRPKGVMTTHAQTVRVFDVWSSVVGLEERDRYLIVNPFFHTFGYKAGILACLMRGATIVPHAVFDPVTVMQRVASERITVLPGPPALYQTILNTPDRPEGSSLRLAVTGAAVVPVELVKRMGAELGFETVLTAYGLTEATGVVTMCRPSDDPETIATTCGCAIPDTEVRVDDSGEVLVRGYNVMKGYWDEPAATAETIDGDGWLHTGDIGVMDERGYLRITDRRKDMFIVGGFNAYPAEIENTLAAHPAVAQVAVVGVPDARLGEVGVAFVVLRAAAALDPGALIAWARERMANYKVPRRVEVVDSLPMNASGKVLKYELRDRGVRGGSRRSTDTKRSSDEAADPPTGRVRA